MLPASDYNSMISLCFSKVTLTIIRFNTKVQFLSFLSQGLKASSWRALNAPCMWFTHQRGKSLLWAAGCAGTPTPSKQHKTFSENQFVYCDFWLLLLLLLLKLSREVWLSHCQVSWALDQVSALRRESSGLLFHHHQYPGSAVSTSCRSLWIQSDLNRGVKKKRKKEEQYNLKKERKKKRK